MRLGFWRQVWQKADFTRRFLMVAAVGAFGAAAAVGMVADGARLPVAPDVQHIVQPLSLPQAPQAALVDDDPLYVRAERIQSGDSVATLLRRLGLSDPALQRFFVQDASARSIYQLYPGRSVQVATDAEGEMRWFRYVHSPAVERQGEVVQQLLEVQRTDDGAYTAAELFIPAERRIDVGVGTIRSSLFGATDAAGVPYAVAQQMINILATDIDFFRDLRRGDQFRVVYESYISDGLRVRTGKVLAIEFVNGGKSYEAVWFDPQKAGESGGYYAFDGSSRRRAFLRAPIEFTRVSSGFGSRRHPILNTIRNHRGVDYAAPPGTPIQATSDGVVDVIEMQRGYGNVVVLKHHGEYSTLYAHMSRFAQGLRKGDRVQQGQVIGYVGSTGMSTGPHLHYEFKIAGVQVDPQSSEIPVMQQLASQHREQFADLVGVYRGQLDMLTALQADQSADIQLADAGL